MQQNHSMNARIRKRFTQLDGYLASNEYNLNFNMNLEAAT